MKIKKICENTKKILTKQTFGIRITNEQEFVKVLLGGNKI